VETIITGVTKSIDPKVKKFDAVSIIEEILAKKPFTKYLTMVLLEGRMNRQLFDN
jgi:hypothetical protein